MNKLVGLALCLAFCFVLAGACHDHDHEPSGATCDPAAGLTYEGFAKPFMTSYCTRCHASTLSGAARNNAPAGHDFDTYLGIMAVADHVDEHAAAGPSAVNEEMPPSDPKPTLDERKKLGTWLACESAFLADGGVPDGL
jgi:uncharacterized membrane protein